MPQDPREILGPIAPSLLWAVPEPVAQGHQLGVASFEVVRLDAALEPVELFDERRVVGVRKCT